MSSCNTLEIQSDINAQSDKLKLLYHQSYPAVFYSLFAALLFAGIMWPQINHTALITWLTALIMSSSARLVLFKVYKQKQPEGQDLLNWEKPYFITLLVSALVWGLGTVLITYNDPLLYQTITYYFLIGMAGSALSVYSAIRYIAISTIGSVLLPITLWFLLQGELTTILISAGGIIFLLSAFRATKVLSQTLHYSFHLTHELTKAKDLAEVQARTDELTGLYNRRAFSEFSAMQIDYCKRYQHPVSLLVLDLDHFKKINDNYGHAAGDSALQHFATVLRQAVRSYDICGRTGGEEFAILLSNAGIDDALLIAEKIRQHIANQPVNILDTHLQITTSIGISSGLYDLETLLNTADNAMYKAKQSGRNQIACHGFNLTETTLNAGD